MRLVAPWLDLDDIELVVERTRLGLDDIDGEEPAVDDRLPDAAALGRAPVIGKRRDPLLVRDEVTVAQELAEADGLERGLWKSRSGDRSRRGHA